jgi:hypothetical protein
MSDSPISLTPSGPPDTILDEEDQEAQDALRSARDTAETERRAAVAAVVARWPRYLEAWARLGDLGRDDVEAYAAYRVGYHRGLDRLRASGWRGSGHVRWRHPGNRGFLRALAGLQDAAARIGETDESERCATFLLQLDPSWPPDDLED